MTNDAAPIERFDPSLDGLLNCVVREVPGWRLRQAGSGQADAFDLKLPGRGLMLRARLRHHSLVGYHAFEPPLLLGAPERLRAAGAVACMALLVEEQALVGPTSQVGRERFLARLAASRRNVGAAFAGAGRWARAPVRWQPRFHRRRAGAPDRAPDPSDPQEL